MIVTKRVEKQKTWQWHVVDVVDVVFVVASATEQAHDDNHNNAAAQHNRASNDADQPRIEWLKKKLINS